MASNIEVPIFTHTNLGTRIAVSVPPDIAARDFKRKFKTVHSKCFPESGEIEIYGIMVKRKSCYYHLTESVPIKNAFEGVRGTWFLHVEARASTKCFEPYFFNPATVDEDLVSNASSLTRTSVPTDSVNSDTKEKPSMNKRTSLVYVSSKKKDESERGKGFVGYKTSGDLSNFVSAGLDNVALPTNNSFDYSRGSISVTEVPSEIFSEVKSVTSIIKRYFPNSYERTGFSSPTSSEATSRRRKYKRNRRCSSVKVKSVSEVANQSRSCFVRSPLLTSYASEKISKSTSVGTAEVGEHLVMATNNLGLLSSTKKCSIHLYRKAVQREDASLIRLSVFDISDSDD